MAISSNILKILYTSRDYLSVYDDLTNSISAITQKWTSREETDPGIVLVKLMSMLGDMLSYNQDKMALEVYPGSVTQRKNAAEIFSLLGYKMKWYRSATCQATLVNTYATVATLPPFSTFKTNNNSVYYTNINQYELPSNTNNNGEEMIVELIQGIPVTPTRKSGKTTPGPNEPWHSIYEYNVDAVDITNKRIYLAYNNVDQDHIVLIDDAGDQWTLVDDVALQIDTGKYFELRVDEFDKPYLYLTNYWENFDVDKFKLFYIKSMGEQGEITANMITGVDSLVYATVGIGGSMQVYNVTSYIHVTNQPSSFGYGPQTPDEAREDSANYINTLNTLVTLNDFRKAVMRYEGVANCLATDCMTDPGLVHTELYGDVNLDGVVDTFDYQTLSQYIDGDIEFTDNQKKLADLNGDGEINGNDLALLQNFINGRVSAAGRAGSAVDLVDPLDTYVVNIYIVRDIENQDKDAETFKNGVYTTLIKDYKMMPLTVNILLEDKINTYYWTVEGSLYTKAPLDLDEAQNLLVAINNELIFEYSADKVDFNSTVKYIDVVNTILTTDTAKVHHVDLAPIKYYDEEGNEVNEQVITGKATESFPKNVGTTRYTINLGYTPIKPGSVVINLEAGAYTLRDNSNYKITDNGKNILVENGTIDYNKGIIEFELNAELTTEFTVSYTQNKINIVKYMNFSTGKFKLDSSSLKA